MPRHQEFALAIPPDPYDEKKAKALLAEAGYPNGFDAGDFTPYPPYNGMGEAIANNLNAVGIKARVRIMERAAFLSAWRDKKLKNVFVGATGAAGNASTRIRAVRHRQGRLITERVMFVPIWENGFIRAYGPRLDEPGLTLIPAFAYSGPLEDVRLKK